MSPSKKILIYGFEPFKQYRKNITQELIFQLPDRQHWLKQVLPVRFESEIFLKSTREAQPDYILGLGQCPHGELIRIERKAYNQCKAHKQDPGIQINPEGPDTTLMNWSIPSNSRRRYSYDAGRYVCNYSMYILSCYAQSHGIKYAFLHIPRDYSIKTGCREVEQILKRVDHPKPSLP